MVSRAAAAVLAALAACGITVPTARAAAEVVAARTLSPRLQELTLRTSALAAPTRVRVLLPAGYAGSRRRYPVLYLLHGAVDDERAWTVKGDAERLTAGLGLIVVMPDSGPLDGYLDWYNAGRGGPPAWERYHIAELLPLIDRRLRTVSGRRGRAVAGLSMGGFGAMSYAARHPDRFVAAASFSGAVDTNNAGIGSVVGEAAYGPRRTQEVRWRAHNPWDLARNLRGLDLVLRTGNGRPGGPLSGGDADGIEQVVHSASTSLHERLRTLGIDHLWEDHGPGEHTWPYWQRDLRRTLPRLMRALRRPPAPPAGVTHRAVEPAYEVFGWRVRVRRPALEFSELRGATRSGFTMHGSGTATVTTPRHHRPGARVRIVARSGGRVVRRAVVAAGPSGRLTVRIALGPGNRRQQYAPGAVTRVHRVAVSLRPR